MISPGHSTDVSDHDQNASFISSIGKWLYSGAEAVWTPKRGSTETDITQPSEVATLPDDETFVPQKRKCRQKRTLYLAHPPSRPHAKSRLSLRPKLVLQLHEAKGNSRPLPVFDILHNAHLHARRSVGCPTFSTSRLPVRRGHDLVVLHAEKYDQSNAQHADSDSDSTDSDNWSAREVVGAVRHHSANEWQIDLHGRSTWIGKRLEDGNYELSSASAQGNDQYTAKWTSKTPKRDSDDTSRRRFEFALTSDRGSSRSCIGTVSSQRINVFDTYTFKTQASTESASSDDRSSISEQSSVHEDSTSEQIRSLVLVSAILIAMQEGWLRAIPNLAKETGPGRELSPLNGAEQRVVSMDIPRGHDRPDKMGSRRHSSFLRRRADSKIDAVLVNEESKSGVETTSPLTSPMPADRQLHGSNGTVADSAGSHAGRDDPSEKPKRLRHWARRRLDSVRSALK